jgi:succinate-acetate transporter protein
VAEFVNPTVPEAVKLVNVPAAAVVLPIAPGDAKVAPLNELAFKFATFVVEVTVSGAVPVDTVLTSVLAVAVVKVPAEAVVVPIAPGDANVAPLNELAFKFATFVLELTISGAVPVDTVLTSVLAVAVVKVPAAAVVLPIAPGDANVAPLNELAFKFATLVVELTISGAVPVATVLVNEFAVAVVNVPAAAVVLPIAPGDANVAPFKELAFKLATLVVELIVNGAVPVAIVLVNELDVVVVPTNNCFAMAAPPAVVNVPPFVALVASTVFLILIPPYSKSEPVVLLVLDVVSRICKVVLNVLIPLFNAITGLLVEPAAFPGT